MPEYLRINFNQIFDSHPDGTLEPKAKVRLGGIEFGRGVRFSRGVQFAGVDIFDFVGRDLAVSKDGDAWVIHGHYAS